MSTLKKDSRSRKVQQKSFLTQLEQTGNITMACRKAKVARRTIYDWLQKDRQFKSAFDESVKIGIELLEDEAQRRAFHGYKKPVYQGGSLVGYVQEYSDTLLIFLLKGKKPEIYKDRQEVTGKDGGPLQTEFAIKVGYGSKTEDSEV